MKQAAQRELTRRYRVALAELESPRLREAARLMGISEREYCDRYVAGHYPPLTWMAFSTNAESIDTEAVWRDALRLHAAAREERR